MMEAEETTQNTPVVPAYPYSSLLRITHWLNVPPFAPDDGERVSDMVGVPRVRAGQAQPGGHLRGAARHGCPGRPARHQPGRRLQGFSPKPHENFRHRGMARGRAALALRPHVALHHQRPDFPSPSALDGGRKALPNKAGRFLRREGDALTPHQNLSSSPPERENSTRFKNSRTTPSYWPG